MPRCNQFSAINLSGVGAQPMNSDTSLPMAMLAVSSIYDGGLNAGGRRHFHPVGVTLNPPATSLTSCLAESSDNAERAMSSDMLARDLSAARDSVACCWNAAMAIVACLLNSD